MSSLNRVMLIGNLTRDPEIRRTAKGQPVGDMSLAMNRSWTNEKNEKQEEATFVDVTVWGKTAENVERFLTKGRAVFVEGRLQLDTWKDAESGQNRSKLKVVAERVQFLGSGRGDSSMGEAAPRENSSFGYRDKSAA